MSNRHHVIAVLPGDGIGPEVIAEAVRVLEAAAEVFGFQLESGTGLIGQAALDQTGRALPPETIHLCRESQGVLLGPVGGSRWEHPTGVHGPRAAVGALRGWLGTYATLRPVRLFPSLLDQSPLRPELARVELMVVHDHSAGLVFGQPRDLRVENGRRVAINTAIYSETEVERVAVVAFGEAMARQKRLVSIDESKRLETGRLWRDVVERVATAFPEVTYARMDPDNFIYELITAPHDFDVVLAAHLLGEQVGITAAALTGSYALHPQAEVGEGCIGMFRPGHGAALDLAGRGVADPLAAIRAAGLLLDYALQEAEAAAAVERAVQDTLIAHIRPMEMHAALGERHSTHEVGTAVLEALKRRGRGGA